MAEIVNLRREKKRRDRAAEADAARENRIRHGRTGAEKERDRLEAERREREGQGARLERDTDPSAAR